MNLAILAVLALLCSAVQAISFSTISTVTVALLGLNKPAHGFFGIFRRRKSPVQETKIPTEQPNPFAFPGQQGFMNPFGLGGGGNNMFFPGMNAPQFGMFGQNRFPPQFKPPLPMKPQQGLRAQPPQFPPQNQFPPQHQNPPQHQRFPPQQQPPQQHFPSEQSEDEEFDGDDTPPGMNTDEAESFFTLLAETDESKCISRLVCEMGANPESGGEFGKTIVDIISSLSDFPDGSKVSEYNEVLSIGVAEGLSSCLSKFSMCDDESYVLVKSAGVDDDGMNR